ncbi:DUF2867 domain-containing protein [Maridesulfovibrio hydrothermalis]|uniref:DUF2867 domain-containing protein n=1 Tax=Maridesulfovibrio hydrothermalis AM13 = DSM 14728 TaxID=1121451 RepID=L0RGZ1_9BACT|nr:DUF2867 domain-containing protein [Maridesulfovibrio hydrothermalis]CCO24851.1 conserved protein of unknown function [Maridesulfovibrio hydrothermalis AM13 = DSM 14728]
MSDSISVVQSIDSLKKLMKDADYMDSKSFTGDCTLIHFLDRMLRYEPVWLRWLYIVRSVLAKLMRLEHDEVGHAKAKVNKFDFTPGGKVDFFTSLDFKADEYWVGEAEDKHLSGYVGVVAEVRPSGRTEFHLFTIVHYRNWTGPVYFNLIRPFHHLIVYFMGKHAVAN